MSKKFLNIDFDPVLIAYFASRLERKVKSVFKRIAEEALVEDGRGGRKCLEYPQAWLEEDWDGNTSPPKKAPVATYARASRHPRPEAAVCAKRMPPASLPFSSRSRQARRPGQSGLYFLDLEQTMLCLIKAFPMRTSRPHSTLGIIGATGIMLLKGKRIPGLETLQSQRVILQNQRVSRWSRSPRSSLRPSRRPLSQPMAGTTCPDPAIITPTRKPDTKAMLMPRTSTRDFIRRPSTNNPELLVTTLAFPAPRQAPGGPWDSLPSCLVKRKPSSQKSGSDCTGLRIWR